MVKYCKSKIRTQCLSYYLLLLFCLDFGFLLTSNLGNGNMSKKEIRKQAKQTRLKQRNAKAAENAKKGLPLMHHLSEKHKVIIMLAVMCAMFLVSLDQTIVATALTYIVNDFHSFSKLSWVVTAYLLTITVSVPLSGKLSDVFGRKPVLLSGVGIFVATSLLTGSSANIDLLIAFRALQGIGAGIIMANAFTIIGDLFTPRERGKWQGLITAVFAISSAVGPMIGGYFADGNGFFGLATSWRWNFWLNVPIGLFAFVMIMIFCPLIKHAKRAKIDYLGSLTLTIALVTIVLATDNTSSIFASWIDHGFSLVAIRAVLLIIAALAIIGFLLAERKASSPVLPLSFFKNRTFTVGMVSMMLFGAAFMSMILYATQFNQQVFGANATTSGLMLLPAVASMGICSAITGQIMTKSGRYKIQMVLGFAIITICGLWWSLTLTSSSTYFQEAIILAVAGLGMGMAMAPLNLAVQNSVPQLHIGVATSSTQLFRSLGQTIGTAILGSMLTAGVASGLGNINQIPYIQTITKSPSASQVIDGQKIDADFALSLNTPEISKKITSGVNEAADNAANSAVDKAVQQALLPYKAMPVSMKSTAEKTIRTQAEQKIAPQVKQKVHDEFNKQQKDFSNKVIQAFTGELKQIFLVVSLIAAIGTCVVAFGIKEHRLRGKLEGEPGVVE